MVVRVFDSEAIEKKLPHAELLRVLSYNAHTGEFRWRVTLSNRNPKGSVAGYNSPTHRRISIYGNAYPAHHIAIYYYSGIYPDLEVDHLDGNGFNNKIDNLRVAGAMINAQNRRNASKNNKTGLLGVCKTTRGARFKSSIRANGKTYNLGQFATAEEAHAAYLKAKRELHEGNTL